MKKRTEAPAYLRIYEQLREDIVRGVYPLGSKLPSKRLTAEETSVSVITVEHAYALLIEEGYIESRERSGYFVAFREEDGFAGQEISVHKEQLSLRQKMLRQLPDQAAATENTADYPFPFSALAKTMRRVLSDYGETLLVRSPNEGIEELRIEISGYLARSRGIMASPEQIIIGAGSEYLYHLIIGLLGRDHCYGLETPSYPIIEHVYAISGVDYERLPLEANGITSEALKNSAADVLHITPYHSFPSGVTASASKRHEYLRWAAKRGRYIVEDDYDSEFSVLKKPEDTLFSQTEEDNIIYVNTFSKSISPSFRVGYMLLPKHLVPVFREKLGFYSCTVPTAIQYVLTELFRNGDFERHINRVRRAKRRMLHEQES